MVERSSRACHVLAAALLMSLAGCSVPYLADRGYDAAQMVGWRMGPAVGSQINLQITKIVQAGWGAYEGKRYGLIDGQLTSQEEIRYEFGLGPLYLHEVETSPKAYSNVVGFVRRDTLDPDYEEYSWDVSDFNDRGFFDIGASLNFFVYGLNFELRTAEMADFITGLFGLDLLADDVQRYEMSALMADLRSTSARTRHNAVRALRIRTGEDYGYASFHEPDVRTDLQRAAIGDWESHHGPRSAPVEPSGSTDVPDEDQAESEG